MNEKGTRVIALMLFRIVHGPGEDSCGEHAFNCRNRSEQEGWMELARTLIHSEKPVAKISDQGRIFFLKSAVKELPVGTILYAQHIGRVFKP